ncbi:MAG: hypothetical protein HQ558_01445, partial [Candidatus Omnitrophica bacterium]|nr:hypothetical protein [Candidatus Omnitrophota bacterium]
TQVATSEGRAVDEEEIERRVKAKFSAIFSNRKRLEEIIKSQVDDTFLSSILAKTLFDGIKIDERTGKRIHDISRSFNIEASGFALANLNFAWASFKLRETGQLKWKREEDKWCKKSDGHTEALEQMESRILKVARQLVPGTPTRILEKVPGTDIRPTPRFPLKIASGAAMLAVAGALVAAVTGVLSPSPLGSEEANLPAIDADAQPAQDNTALPAQPNQADTAAASTQFSAEALMSFADGLHRVATGDQNRAHIPNEFGCKSLKELAEKLRVIISEGLKQNKDTQVAAMRCLAYIVKHYHSEGKTNGFTDNDYKQARKAIRAALTEAEKVKDPELHAAAIGFGSMMGEVKVDELLKIISYPNEQPFSVWIAGL